MQAEAFEGCNCVLGSPSDANGDPMRVIEEFPVCMSDTGFVSQWRPSKTEIGMIVRGAPIRLYVLGAAHPPVMLEVVDTRLLPRVEAE